MLWRSWDSHVDMNFLCWDSLVIQTKNFISCTSSMKAALGENGGRELHTHIAELLHHWCTTGKQRLVTVWWMQLYWVYAQTYMMIGTKFHMGAFHPKTISSKPAVSNTPCLASSKPIVMWLSQSYYDECEWLKGAGGPAFFIQISCCENLRILLLFSYCTELVFNCYFFVPLHP